MDPTAFGPQSDPDTVTGQAPGTATAAARRARLLHRPGRATIDQAVAAAGRAFPSGNASQTSSKRQLRWS